MGFGSSELLEELPVESPRCATSRSTAERPDPSVAQRAAKQMILVYYYAKQSTFDFQTKNSTVKHCELMWLNFLLYNISSQVVPIKIIS